MRLPYLNQLTFSTGFNLVWRLLPAYLTRFSSSATQIGLVGSAYSFGKMLRIVLAPLADKHGVEKAVFVSLLFLPPLAFAGMFAGSIPLFAAIFFGVGLLNGVYYSALSALVGLRKKEKLEGQFHLESMYQFGLVVGPLAGGALALQWGMAAVFGVWGVLALVTLGIAFLLLRQRPVHERKPLLRMPWRLLAKPAVFGGLLAGVFTMAIDLAVPIALARAGFGLAGIGVVIAGGALLCGAALVMLGRKLEGRRRRGTMALFFALMGISMALLSLTTAMLAVIVLVGVGYLGRTGALNIARARVATELPAERQGSGMAVIDTVFSVGQIIGPVLAGLLIDGFGASAAFLAIGAAFLILAVPALRG